MTVRLQLQIFSKAPVAGTVKTRLIPALGADGAARLQQRMTQAMVANAVRSELGEVVLYCAPDCSHATFLQLQQQYGVLLQTQQGGDIGARMATAMGRGLQQSDAVLLMGCDCPQLNQRMLAAVAEALGESEVVLIPAEDGGYVLVAMRHPLLEIFSEITWSSVMVLSQTEAILKRLGARWTLLPRVRDIDRPEDLCVIPKEWMDEWAA